MISVNLQSWTQLLRYFASKVQHFPRATYFGNFSYPFPSNQCCLARNVVYTIYCNAFVSTGFVQDCRSISRSNGVIVRLSVILKRTVVGGSD